MATENNVKIILSASDKSSKAFSDVNNSLGGLGKNVSSWVDKNSAAIRGIGVASAAALVGIGAFAKGAIDAANEQAKANTQLEATLKSTKGAVGLTSKEIQNYATQLQNTTGIEDDTIQSAQNMLLTFTNIGKSAFPLATQAALDMATAMNGGAKPGAEQLRDTSIQLGKALNDPIVGLTALKRVGVAFTESQKDQIKTLQESGDMMGAQKIILDELAKEFGGSAVAQTKTFEGQMGLINVQLKDANETIGFALIPVLQDLMKTLSPLLIQLAAWIQANPTLTKDLILAAAAIAAVGSALLIIAPIMTAVTAAQGLMTAATGALSTALAFLAANPIVLITAAIIGLGVVIYEVIKNWDIVKPKLLEFWESVVSGVKITIEKLKTYFTTTFPALTFIIKTEWEIMGKIIDKMKDGVDWAKGAIQSVRNIGGDIYKATHPIAGGVPLEAKANGGPVNAGQTYLVGERGPELFTARTSGQIIPNGAASGVNISINMGGVTVQNEADENRLVQKVSEKLTRQMQLYKLGIA